MSSNFLAKNIKQLRYRAGLRREDMAKQLGISVKTMRKWEKGIETPEKKDIIKIANRFDIDNIDDLYNVEIIKTKWSIRKLSVIMYLLQILIFSIYLLGFVVYGNVPFTWETTKYMLCGLIMSTLTIIFSSHITKKFTYNDFIKKTTMTKEEIKKLDSSIRYIEFNINLMSLILVIILFIYALLQGNSSIIFVLIYLIEMLIVSIIISFKK